MATDSPHESTDWLAAENVLLDGVPQIPIGELAERLAFAPFEKLDREHLSNETRMEYLEMTRLPYEPTKQGVTAAAKVLAMLRGGLIARNPLVVENRRARMKLLAAEACNATTVPKITSASFAVRVWTGMTGVGKSALRSRVLSLLPQVIERGPCPNLWERLSQLVYLQISLLDGTKGGFLESILTGMDDALGTSYAVDLPKRHRTVDRLLVGVIGRMHHHYLGLLVIEEAQWRNLIGSPRAAEMQVFLLSVMNSGIPVLIIGNPSAFSWMEDFTQDARRLHERGWEFFHPIGSMDEKSAVDDQKAVSYGVTSYYVLKDLPRDLSGCRAFLEDNLGGIVGHELTLWCNAQESAITEGKSSIGPEDLEVELRAERFASNRRVVDAFKARQSWELRLMKDVPWEVYATACEQGASAPASLGASASDSPEPTVAESTSAAELEARIAALGKKERQRFAANQTRASNRAVKRSALQESLQSGDMRLDGLQQHAIEGIANMFKEIDSTKKRKGKVAGK